MTVAGLTPERIALNKLTYGPRPSEVAIVEQVIGGLGIFVEQQLAASESDDGLTQALVAAATLPIKYDASTTYPAVNENRRLTILSETPSELWTRVSGGSAIAPAEVSFAPYAVRAASYIRAVNSAYPLKEMMVEFWHNHFNMDAFSSTPIAAMFPAYDRIMRQNWNGNFRKFLEAIATSADMGFYLNNALSRANQPNENYARELMELHTLGRDAYFDHQYASWDLVPQDASGTPVGFIDDDVFGAARALSGWTIATGQKVGTRTYPNDGSFIYVPEYHATQLARVLGVQVGTMTQPMEAGRKVLDLVAFHPATALFVCTKIIRRLVADTPPKSLLDKAVAKFIAAKDAPDQIAQVLRVIALSDEIKSPANAAAKFRRPYERVIGLVRMIGAGIQPNFSLFNAMSATGYVQFNWGPPTGHPDVPSFWLNTNTTLKTWNIMLSLFSGSSAAVSGSLLDQSPKGANGDGMISYWCHRLLGGMPSAATLIGLTADAQDSAGITTAINRGNTTQIENALRRLVGLIGATEEFSYR